MLRDQQNTYKGPIVEKVWIAAETAYLPALILTKSSKTAIVWFGLLGFMAYQPL